MYVFCMKYLLRNEIKIFSVQFVEDSVNTVVAIYLCVSGVNIKVQNRSKDSSHQEEGRVNGEVIKWVQNDIQDSFYKGFYYTIFAK